MILGLDIDFVELYTLCIKFLCTQEAHVYIERSGEERLFIR